MYSVARFAAFILGGLSFEGRPILSDHNSHKSTPHSEGNQPKPVRNAVAGDVHGPVIQAGAINVRGGVQFRAPGLSQLPIPAQLPSPGFFVNRDAEQLDLRLLVEHAAAERGPVVIVIGGPGGVGKTTLSLHWLHQLRDDYGDGQLFIDLQGFSGRNEPMPPTEPLEQFLRALGVDAERIPVVEAEQAALFRSLTADRRLIVLLDNAVSAAQVRPLIPGPGPALVVVTTRRRLTGLTMAAARFFEVGPFDEQGAVALLDRLVGSDRLEHELGEARSVVRLCGCLPLAVCATGARLIARRRLTLARVVQELTDESRRLAVLSMDEEISIKTVFDLSYQDLPDAVARRIYRLLGVHPGADFDLSAAAALADLGPEETAALLESLVTANLLEEAAEDRFRFHDLVRLHAREKLVSEEPVPEHEAAFNRLVLYYHMTAAAAEVTISPSRWRLGDHYDSAPRDTFADRKQALAWLELERGNLIAILKEAHRQGLSTVAWQLCEAMRGLFSLHKHYRLWIESHEIAVAAARACQNLRAEARMLGLLGAAYFNLRDYTTAVAYYGEALEREHQADHPVGEAVALEGLGNAELALRRYDSAIEHFAQARRIHKIIGRQRGIAVITRRLGQALSQAGSHLEAIEELTDALEYFSRRDEPYHQARTLGFLADAYMRTGQFDRAAEALHASLAITEEIDARHEQANVHAALARLAAARGEAADEEDHLHQALHIYTELNAPQVQDIQQRLARLRGSGD
jgi:tetratricopeptide (TPR) repeat protein